METVVVFIYRNGHFSDPIIIELFPNEVSENIILRYVRIFASVFFSFYFVVCRM